MIGSETLQMSYRETVQSERLYRRVAPSYEQVFERAILAESRLTSLVRRHMDGRRVLDLACGNGRWLRRFRPGDYTGLDLSDAMLEQARREFPGQSFVRGDMTSLPFPDGSFDGIVSLFGPMGHLPPRGQLRMIREVYRVLRPGGVTILTNGNIWSPFSLPLLLMGHRVRIEGVRVRIHSSNPRQFKARLEEAGFEAQEVSSYDYSYLPIAPLKLGASLVGQDYRAAYAGLMETLENCCHIPVLRWFGKQLLAVCRKPA